MRFSAAIQSQRPLHTDAATDLVRRIVSVPLAQPQPAETAPAERDLLLPVDLDQRVRLVGEW